MSFVCVICDDFLTAVEGDDGPPNPIVTTTCGHVYHQKCIHDWFEAKERNDAREENYGRQLDNSKKCPTCQENTSSEELIRIFPTEEIDNSEQVNLSTDMDNTEDTTPKTRAKLLSENKKLREELKGIQTCRMYDEENWVALLEEMRLENEAKVRALQSQINSQMLQSRGTGTSAQALDTLVEETPNEFATAISMPVQRSRIRNSLSVKPLETTMGGLKIGDMVVWPSPDEENHNGRVTWIGIVDNVILAAVLCDYAIGNTNGVINEKLRFECNPEYTRLIPVRELILQEDFYPSAVNQGAETNNAAAAVAVE